MITEQQMMGVKRMLVEQLRLRMEPAAIGNLMPLFREGLGLDSVDAIELVAAIERSYGIVITNEGKAREAFRNVGTLAAYIVAEGGSL